MSEEAQTDPRILERVQAAVRKRVLFLPHAVRQMAGPERMISASTVQEVIFGGEVVEDYPEDARGHSCLILGREPDTNEPIHVVCAPKEEYLAVITAYRPASEQWNADFRRRS